MTTRKVTITGPLSDEDLARFAAVLREIDQANPKNIYRFTVADAQMTMDEVEAMLMAKLLPPLPFRATAFARAAYQDDSCPERACDRCGKVYRGPAVYCSLECALEDA